VEAFGEATEGELTGDVGEEMGDGNLSADGGDVDDRGFATVDLCLLEDAGEGGQDGVEGTEEVSVHGALEGDEGLVFNGPDFDDSGVVDEDIDAAEVVVGLVDKVLGLRRIGEIHGDEEDVGGASGAFVEKSLATAVEFVVVAGGEDEAATGATEAVSQSEAETTGAARDDDDLT